MARLTVASNLFPVAGSNRSIEMPSPLAGTGNQRVSREDARSLELLSHAIQHLSDQYVGEDCSPAVEKSINKAIQLLMSLHRSVFEESRLNTASRSSSWLFLDRLAG